MLAFIPLTHSVFLGPLAYTLIGGAFARTILTLARRTGQPCFEPTNRKDGRPGQERGHPVSPSASRGAAVFAYQGVVPGADVAQQMVHVVDRQSHPLERLRTEP